MYIKQVLSKIWAVSGIRAPSGPKPPDKRGSTVQLLVIIKHHLSSRGRSRGEGGEKGQLPPPLPFSTPCDIVLCSWATNSVKKLL